jgi:hypothetical protein
MESSFKETSKAKLAPESDQFIEITLALLPPENT